MFGIGSMIGLTAYIQAYLKQLIEWLTQVAIHLLQTVHVIKTSSFHVHEAQAESRLAKAMLLSISQLFYVQPPEIDHSAESVWVLGGHEGPFIYAAYPGAKRRDDHNHGRECEVGWSRHSPQPEREGELLRPETG